MQPLPSSPTAQAPRAARAFRWDLIAIALGVGFALIFVVLVDTGWLARWLATNKDAKVDEVIVVSFVLVCGLALFSIRRWLGYSYRVIKFESSQEPTYLASASQVQASFRRDLIGVSIALVLAVVAVAVLDTGSLAEWVASQSHTRVDEAIVATFMLMIGLSFFSIRRWIELSQQLVKFEELHRMTSQLNREARLLAELSDLLQSCRSLAEAYQLIADRARVLFPQSAGAVCMIANSRDVVDVATSWGAPSLTHPFFQPADCWALRRGRVQALDPDPGGVCCSHIGPGRPTRALCVPMMAHGEALGLLYLDECAETAAGTGPRGWSDAEQRLARTLAEQAALALANLTLRDTLRLQSIRDPLTGLYNRRYLEESLERELRRAARTGLPVGVMMIDLDHFKQLNDMSGHDAGDAVLQAFAGVLLSSLSPEDVVCRYGGEEFTMILSEASLEVTRQRAEAVRERTMRLAVQLRGQTLAPVTISIGIASYPADGVTAEGVLRAADAALYRAKEAGRNRVLAA